MTTTRRLFAFVLLGAAASVSAQTIPLPEHPRPDFERAAWQSLNGTWDFQFDAADAGQTAGWAASGLPAPRPITVPFPWGAPLSGVPDEAQIGWYERSVTVPDDWDGQRIFLTVGASDWLTTAYVDGREVGTHQGGYTPFSFEITPLVRAGGTHRLTIRVDDVERPFTLEGKQGYGDARGIWQTPYLEARGTTPLAAVHLAPDVPGQTVHVEARLLEAAPRDLTLRLRFTNASLPETTARVRAGSDRVAFDVAVPNPHLWSLDDPFLYTVEARLEGVGMPDVVTTYFGMRQISVVDLPGTDIPYVALNGEPVYLQLALDQNYHPEGFYTFPTDAFIRDEMLRAKQIGLNGVRIHIKVPIPRSLYWADRLGLLVMADVPNGWGEPTAEQAAETEAALRGMIDRDFNHPSVFSWITFNESWGLKTKQGEDWTYLPETFPYVASVYRLAKSLDPTRLVEDNSPCCGYGHTETDLNSWHAYKRGDQWESELDWMSRDTYSGSQWNFEPGYVQGRQPNINSEFGNVWGYEGSTGDVDYSWEYHRAVDAFRRHPKIAGWLYTELTDVINEWNGYWRFDRSEKVTGFGDLADGMTLRDLHAPLYVAVGDRSSYSAAPGERLAISLVASFMTGSRAYSDSLTLRTTVTGWDALGRQSTLGEQTRRIPYRPWMTGVLDSLVVTAPAGPAVVVVATRLEDAAGSVLQRNFTTVVVEGDAPNTMRLGDGREARLASVAPSAVSASSWSLSQWPVLDGLKQNGAGSGFFEYTVPWPAGLDPARVASASFLAEVSAKQLLGKDRDSTMTAEGDYMRGGGFADPSANRNAYPMTDETRFPSAVTVRINGAPAARWLLADDPADSRGILSWHAQPQDNHLHEAGSYGELREAAVPRTALETAARTGTLVVRLEVDEALPGGLAVYGRHFGRYPLDPTVVFALRP